MRFITCRDTNTLYKYPVHTHNNWELICQSMGSSYSYINGKAYHMAEGDLLLIPPHIPHSCEGDALFGDMFIQFSSCKLPLTAHLIHDIDGNIGRLMKMIIKLYTEKEFFHEEIIDSLLGAILCYLQKSADTVITYPFVHDFKDKLYKILGNSDFDLGDAISKSGYHPDYFRRCFKKELGISPLEYLTELRITRAEELLVQDDFSGIEKVAAECGFSDSFYFSTCFKKHRGISPFSYRKTKLSGRN